MNKFIVFFISLFAIVLVGCSENVEKDDSPVLYSFDKKDYTLNNFKNEEYYGAVDVNDLLLYSLIKDRYEVSEENLNYLKQEKEVVKQTFKDITKDIKDESELEMINLEEKNELFYVELDVYLDTFLDNVIQVMPSEVEKLSKDYYLIKAVVGYFGGSVTENQYKYYLEKIKTVDSEKEIYEIDDLMSKEELDAMVSYQELTKKTLADNSHYTLMDSKVGDVLEFEATTRNPKMVYKVLDKVLASEDVVYEDIRNEKATKLFTDKISYFDYFTTVDKLKFTYNEDIFNLINE